MANFESDPTVQTLLQHEQFLCSLAQGLLADVHLSEDVVQATWLAALQRSRSERPWLSTVVRNLASKLRRSEVRRSARERAAARPEEVPPASHGVERAEILRSVTDAVVALEEPYRSTILQCYIEGLTPREIAEREGVPLATVRSRRARALDQLRGRLDRAHPGGRAAWGAGLVHLLSGHPAPMVGESSVQSVSSGGTGGWSPGSVAAASAAAPKTKIAALAAVLIVGFATVWSLAAAFPDAGLAEPRLPTAAIATPGADGEARTLASATGLELRRVSVNELPVEHGSLRARVSWADGTPAGGVFVNVMQWGTSHPFLTRRYHQADSDGVLEVERVVPGKVVLYVDRGGSESVEIESGIEANVDVTIPKGLNVTGVVVDLEGNPIADAEIWLSAYANASHGLPVTRAGKDGRFFLKSVGSQHGVGARKAGHAPSPCQRVEGSAGDTVDMRLVLQGLGGRLAVRVLDGNGRAVRGALVRISGTRPRMDGYPSEQRLHSPIPYELSTDEDGRCVAQSLSVGETEIVVSEEGHAPSTKILDLAAGASAYHEVFLEPGVAVFGVVRDLDRGPLEGVRVGVGRYGDIETREAKSGADGSFRIEGVAAGEIRIRAGGRRVGYDESRLRGVSGESIEWNPVIDAGLVLRARLVDEAGQGLSGWQVTALSDRAANYRRDGFRGQASTDEDGWFRILNCPDEPLLVRVNESFQPMVFPEAEYGDVVPGAADRELVVLDSWRLSSSVDGILEGDDGKPASAKVMLCREGDRRCLHCWSNVATGAFRFGPLASGAYTLDALSDDNARFVQEVAVESDQQIDLGSVRLRAPGRLIIDVLGIDGAPPKDLSFDLRRVDLGTPYQKRYRVTELTGGIEVPVGRYALKILGPVVNDTYEFTIEAATTTRVDVTPRLGLPVSFAFTLPPGHEFPEEVTVVSRNPDRSVAWEQTVYLHPENRGWAKVMVPRAESYELEFESKTGLRGRVVFDGSEAAPIPVSLE